MKTHLRKTRRISLVVLACVIASCSVTEQQGGTATTVAPVAEVPRVLGADEDVRRIVAGSSSTSPDILAKLAGDKYDEVRRSVVLNPSTP